MSGASPAFAIARQREEPGARLRPSVEGEVAGGLSARVVAVVVGTVVVEGAEQGTVGDVSGAATGPGLVGVVGFAPGGGNVAAFGAAVPVADGHRLALGWGEQAAGAAEVEDFGGTAE